MSSTFLPSTWSAAASSCTSRPEGSRSIQTGEFAEPSRFEFQNPSASIRKFSRRGEVSPRRIDLSLRGPLSTGSRTTLDTRRWDERRRFPRIQRGHSPERPENFRGSSLQPSFTEHFQSKAGKRRIHIFAGLGAGAHDFPAALGELSQTVVANFPLIGQIGFVHEKDCRYFEAGVGDALIEGQSFVY